MQFIFIGDNRLLTLYLNAVHLFVLHQLSQPLFTVSSSLKKQKQLQTVRTPDQTHTTT